MILLGSNLRPQLHLSLAYEALDRVFPLAAELGRCRAAAIGGHGIYHNRLLLCRVSVALAQPSVIDQRCRVLEAELARREGGSLCPVDLDPFLIVHAHGRVSSFTRTAKVQKLLTSIDPERRLGLPAWAR